MAFLIARFLGDFLLPHSLGKSQSPKNLSPSTFSWNQVYAWLREVALLREACAA